MSLKGLRFTLEVDGQEPDTFAVVNFRLIQNQSYPFVMSVDVASDSFMQTAEMLLEKNATLTIWQGVIPLRYVTGVVAGFGMQENNGWQMRYHLRIEPPLWRCGLRRNFRIFQQQDIRRSVQAFPMIQDGPGQTRHIQARALTRGSQMGRGRQGKNNAAPPPEPAPAGAADRPQPPRTPARRLGTRRIPPRRAHRSAQALQPGPPRPPGAEPATGSP